MFDINAHVDSTDGVWLVVEARVDVPAARAFTEVATAEGISAWFSPTTLDPEVGGELLQGLDPTVGPDSPDFAEMATRGTVTEYRAPSAFGAGRFAYVERDWMGPGMPVDPWITSFEVAESGHESGAATLITLRSGFEQDSQLGRTSAEESETGWTQAMHCLAHRLTAFPDGGARITQALSDVRPGSVEAMWARAAKALRIPEGTEPGTHIDAASRAGRVAGTVLHASEGAAVLALSSPGVGTLNVYCFPAGESASEATSHAQLAARFAEPADAPSDWDSIRWQRWLDSLA